MFRRISLSIFLVLYLLVCAIISDAQNGKVTNLFKQFASFYSKGNFITSERLLLEIASIKDSLSVEQSIAVYNNLGVIYIRLGRYDEAITYLNQAEEKITDIKEFSQELADVYTNKARVFGILKEYDKAIDYLEQAIKVYLTAKEVSKPLLFRTSTAFLNLGLTYYEKKDYNTAIRYLNKSLNIKLSNNLSEIALPYLNLAKTYSKLNQVKKAQQYYLKSIMAFDNEFGPNYYRLTSVLFDYGLFLQSIGRVQESYDIHKKALEICLRNYGEKHTYVSMAYKLLGDHFLIKNEFKTALKYYQKSVITVVNNFNDTCIYTNPSLDSVIFDIRLLDNLKQKSLALEQYALQQSESIAEKQVLIKSLETIELALELIGRIRSGYVSIESKMYLADHEKETYLLAIQIADQLYNLTNDRDYIKKMYSFATLCKSAILRNDLAENEFIYRDLSDSLYIKRNTLLINISSYKKLIQDELQKAIPDSQRIEFWKSTIFEMSREEERVSERIKESSPAYELLLRQTSPTDLATLQDNLEKNETLVEYFLSNHYSEGKKQLYIFTITKNQISCDNSYLDSSFTIQVENIKHNLINPESSSLFKHNYASYTNALYYMYNKLIKPVENCFVGEKLIIIPDEEIAFLAFDAFVRNLPEENHSDYESLNYLLNDYSITYSYTSSLAFKKQKRRLKKLRVYAFSPSYNVEGLDELNGTKKEIKALYNWFDGIAFYGEKASEHNFKETIRQPAIFHLAMHSQTDSSNSKYSCLIFDKKGDAFEDGRLYNYEISLCRMESPMVVLSACSTASGDLYHGEGVMSLARGFLLAGASSVVNTLWDVNDDASAKIMSDFYQYLSRGYEKGDALRIAKLNYLKSTPPTYANPYYWAAYEVMGDKSPLTPRNSIVYYVIVLAISVALISIFIYLRRSSKS